MSDVPAADPEGKPSHDAKLTARRTVIEQEMEAAPSHRLSTAWWDERVTEIKLTERRLRK